MTTAVVAVTTLTEPVAVTTALNVPLYGYTCVTVLPGTIAKPSPKFHV